MGKMSSKFRLGTFAGALGVALMAATSAFASPITVGGVTFGLGSNLKSTTIWENIVAGGGGATLSGIGRVDTIDAPDCGGLCWSNGNNNTSLLFTFQYTLLAPGIIPDGFGGFRAFFGAGSAHFYTHNPASAALFNGATLTAALNSVTVGGTPRLDLIGHLNENAAFVPGAQLSSQYNLDANGIPTGQGGGYFDVDLSGTGAANAYWNTNTFHVLSGIVDEGFADVRIHSSFGADKSGANHAFFPLSGVADLSDSSKTIPEPGSLLLLGSGLLGLAGLRRKRKRA
jgi:hypothetical protein